MTWSGPVEPAWLATGSSDPFRANRRAATYFLLCVTAAAATGSLSGRALDPDHLSSAAWWLSTLAILGLEVWAYGVLWPRGTFTAGRPRTPYSTAFGVVWGACQGLLFLSVVRHLPAWLAVLVLAGFQGGFHALWWDRAVAPAHNVPTWNLRKVLLAHVPNLAATVLWWSVWADPLPFVLFQVVALAASARAMCFPAPR